MKGSPTRPASTKRRALNLRLSRDHQVHWCKQTLLPTRDQAVCSHCQAIRRFLSPHGCNAYHFQPTNKPMDDAPPDFCHPQNCQEIPNAAHVAEVTGQWIIPGRRVPSLSQVLMKL